MILLLDTSTPICKVTFVDVDKRASHEWHADRDLAEDLLGYLEKLLQKDGKSWKDISAIGVFKGPGSFTGLRIGMSVVNAIARVNNVPIVAQGGSNWIDAALKRLKAGEDEKLALPLYGRPANITKPRK